VKLLLEKGADARLKDRRDDQTPLLLAAYNRCEAVVKLLLEKGTGSGVQGCRVRSDAAVVGSQERA
jgi:ankyrin repeat protein